MLREFIRFDKNPSYIYTYTSFNNNLPYLTYMQNKKEQFLD